MPKLTPHEFTKRFDQLFTTHKGVPSFSFALKGNSGASKVKVKFYLPDGNILMLRFKGPYTDGLKLHDYVNKKVRARIDSSPPPKKPHKSDDSEE